MMYDWLKIRTEFYTNRVASLEDMATKYNVNYSYLRDVAAKEKWTEEKEQIWQKSSTKLAETLPDKIADVKLRHVRIAKVMQSKMIERIRSDKIDSRSTYTDLKTAIDIERDALGLNDKKTNEELQQLQQFNFILNLKPDELRRFIKSVESRAAIASSSHSQDDAQQASEDPGGTIVEPTELSG